MNIIILQKNCSVARSDGLSALRVKTCWKLHLLRLIRRTIPTLLRLNILPTFLFIFAFGVAVEIDAPGLTHNLSNLQSWGFFVENLGGGEVLRINFLMQLVILAMFIIALLSNKLRIRAGVAVVDAQHFLMMNKHLSWKPFDNPIVHERVEWG